MLKQNAFSTRTIFLLLFVLLYSFSAFSQNDEVEIEIPTTKNAIGLRPLSAFFGFYGVSYERYIAKNFSVYGYFEYSDGPKLFNNNINNWIKGSMGLERSQIYYSGYGGALGVRRYFKDPKFSLVGDKDQGSITGWFVGAFVPVRQMKISLRTQSVEYNSYYKSNDFGSYKFDGLVYGLGLEGGKHWVWDNFSFELNIGFTYMQGIPKSAKFEYIRPVIGKYEVEKDLGIINFYGTFAPKFEIVMGVGF